MTRTEFSPFAYSSNVIAVTELLVYINAHIFYIFAMMHFSTINVYANSFGNAQALFELKSIPTIWYISCFSLSVITRCIMFIQRQ